jgi:hypothetical protein
MKRTISSRNQRIVWVEIYFSGWKYTSVGGNILQWVGISFSGWKYTSVGGEYTSVPGVRVAHYLKTKIVLSYYVSLHSEYRVLMSATISA